MVLYVYRVDLVSLSIKHASSIRTQENNQDLKILHVSKTM